MNETRKWISTRYLLPDEGQKIYYFCDFLGIFRGEYHLEKTRVAIALSPHTFISNHGKLDSDEVTYWMPYDHALKDIIPLPPNYQKVDINHSQSMINSGLDLNFDEIEIPQEHRQMQFSYEIMGEI